MRGAKTEAIGEQLIFRIEIEQAAKSGKSLVGVVGGKVVVAQPQGGDLSDRALLESLVAGKDAVIHVALKYDEKRPGWQVLMDDTLPTVFLAEAAAGAGVGRFIYTSSTACNDSVYSGPPEYRDRIKLATTATKQRPATFYGATKAASENFLMALAHLSKMKINIVRPGYAFGNPAIEGGSIEGDIRFRNIARGRQGARRSGWSRTTALSSSSRGTSRSSTSPSWAATGAVGPITAFRRPSSRGRTSPSRPLSAAARGARSKSKTSAGRKKGPCGTFRT